MSGIKHATPALGFLDSSSSFLFTSQAQERQCRRCLQPIKSLRPPTLAGLSQTPICTTVTLLDAATFIKLVLANADLWPRTDGWCWHFALMMIHLGHTLTSSWGRPSSWGKPSSWQQRASWSRASWGPGKIKNETKELKISFPAHPQSSGSFRDRKSVV